MADNNDRLGVEVELTPSPSKEEFQKKINKQYQGLKLGIDMGDDFDELNSKIENVIAKLATAAQKKMSSGTKQTKLNAQKDLREMQKQLLRFEGLSSKIKFLPEVNGVKAFTEDLKTYQSHVRSTIDLLREANRLVNDGDTSDPLALNKVLQDLKALIALREEEARIGKQITDEQVRKEKEAEKAVKAQARETEKRNNEQLKFEKAQIEQVYRLKKRILELQSSRDSMTAKTGMTTDPNDFLPQVMKMGDGKTISDIFKMADWTGIDEHNWSTLPSALIQAGVSADVLKKIIVDIEAVTGAINNTLNDITAASAQEIWAEEEKEKDLSSILQLLEQIHKLQNQINHTGISLNLSDYNSSVGSADDLVELAGDMAKDSKKYTPEQVAGVKADLSRTIAIGNAKYSTYTQEKDAATQLANLNHQINEYIKNNSKIKSSKGLYTELYRLNKEIEAGTINVEDAQQKFADLKAQFGALNLETQSLSDRLVKLFKDHFNTAIAMAGIHALQSGLRAIISSITEIDSAMTELKKVTNETDSAYEKFLDRAADKAQILGSAISDVITATADFARLGYSLPDAEQLADAAIVYKNVGDGIDDISTASESIISTMKAFGYSAEEAMAIVDKFNYVGNNFAISSVGIGEALKRSAAALAQSNNDLAESIALVTAGNNVIQDPDAVGTALKTLSLRLSTTKTELEELGEDTDGAAESTSEYRSEILAITRAAGDEVDILNEAGDAYKSTYQILYELSNVWDDIDQKEQQSLLYLLGGARQANVLASILKNFKDAEKVVAQLSSGAADGSALEENEKYLDSIAGKLDQINASFQSLSSHTINSELVKGLLDIANALVKIADIGIDGIGILPLLRGALTGTMAADGKSFFRKDIVSDMGLGQTFANLKETGLFASIDMYGLHHNYNLDAKKIRDIANKGQDLGNIKTLMAAEKALDKDVYEHLNKILKETGDNFDAVKTNLLTYADALESSSDKLSSFTTKAIAFAKQMAIMVAVGLAIKAVSAAVDELYVSLDEAREKVSETSSALQEATTELEKLRELEGSAQGLTDEEKARLDYLKEYVYYLEQRNNANQREYNKKDLLDEDYWLFNGGNTKRELGQVLGEKTAKMVYGWVDERYLSAEDKKKSGNYQQLKGELDKEISQLMKFQTTYQNAFDLAIDTAEKEKYQTILGFISKKLEENKAAIEYMQGIGVIAPDDREEKDRAAIQKETMKTWNIIQGIKKDGKDISDSLDWSKELQRNTGYAQLLKDKINEIASDISITSLNEEIDSMQTSLDTVISAYQEYNAKGSYSLDTLQALTELEPRYLSLLIDEQGRLQLNEQRIKDLTQARINEMRIKIVQNAISSIENLTSEAAATEYLTKAQIDLNAAEYEGAKAALALAAGNAIARGGAIEEATRAIVEQTNILLGAIGAWDGYGLSGSGALDDVGKAAEEAKKKVNDALKDQGDMMLKVLDKRKDALQDELDALEDRYEAEDKEFELQKRINAYQAAQAKKTVRLYTHDKGWQWVVDPTALKEAQDAVEEYQRELERDEAKKAIQDQIDAIDDLRDRVQDAMDSIGNEFMDSRDDLALMAELEGMTYDQLGDWAEDYARRVKAANAEVVESYDGVSKRIQGLFGTAPEDEIVPVKDVERLKLIQQLQDQLKNGPDIMNGEAYYLEEFGTAQRILSESIDELAKSAEVMDGEMAYYAEMAAQHGEKWIGTLEEIRQHRTEDRELDIEETQLYYDDLNERMYLYYENAKMQGEDFALFYIDRINQIINAIRTAIEAINRFSKAFSEKSGNSPLPSNYIYNPTTGTAIPKFHSGGLVRGVSDGANVSGEFLKYMKNIKRDEVPAVLQAGEYVLTKQNQADILNDRTALLNSVKTSRNQSIQIGDIIINQPVGNAETLSKAIIAKLPTQIMRDLYK